MNKAKLSTTIEAKEKRIAELRAIADKSEDAAEIRKCLVEKEALENDIAFMRSVFDDEGFDPASVTREKETSDPEEVRSSEAYRTAFFKNVMHKPLNDAEKRAIDSLDVPGLLPTITQESIMSKIKARCPILDEITLLRVAANITINVDTDDGAEAELHTENAALTSSDEKPVAVTLGGYEICKTVRISKKVETMSVSGFESWLVSMLVRKITKKLNAFLANGTGSSQPTGVMAANVWTDGTNAVEWDASGLAEEDIYDVIALLPDSYDENAKFWMSKATFFKNVYPLMNNSKSDIVAREGKDYYIAGYPVIISAGPAADTIILGDFEMLVANLAEDISVERCAESGFVYNAIDFRGSCIFDSKVADGNAFRLLAASV